MKDSTKTFCSVVESNARILDCVCHDMPIPNELILEHNKLLNDYNEALKQEKYGK